MLKAQFKILVADGDPLVRRAVNRLFLQNIGFRSVLEAKDGEMAWDRIIEGLGLSDPVRLVIADWSLPRVSGLELLQKMRYDERLETVPFMMLSQGIDRGKVEQGIAAGVTDFLEKPLKIAAVREKVGAIYQASLPRPVRPTDLRILVIDDDEDVLNNVIHMFLSMGFHDVRGFTDAEIAWADALLASGKNEPYELIVSDWSMPRTTGFDLLQRVRQHPVLRATPFFLLTGQAERDRVLNAIDAGATSFITKPFKLAVMREKLAACAAACVKHPEVHSARWRGIQELMERLEKRLNSEAS